MSISSGPEQSFIVNSDDYEFRIKDYSPAHKKSAGTSEPRDQADVETHHSVFDLIAIERPEDEGARVVCEENPSIGPSILQVDIAEIVDHLKRSVDTGAPLHSAKEITTPERVLEDPVMHVRYSNLGRSSRRSSEEVSSDFNVPHSYQAPKADSPTPLQRRAATTRAKKVQPVDEDIFTRDDHPSEASTEMADEVQTADRESLGRPYLRVESPAFDEENITMKATANVIIHSNGKPSRKRKRMTTYSTPGTSTAKRRQRGKSSREKSGHEDEDDVVISSKTLSSVINGSAKSTKRKKGEP